MKKYIKISGKEKEWIETALNVSWKSHTNLPPPGKVF